MARLTGEPAALAKPPQHLMKKDKALIESIVLFIGNGIVATLVFAGMYLIHQKSIGKGSMPMLAIAGGFMMVAIFEWCYLIISNGKKNEIKLLVLIAFGALALTILLAAIGYQR